MNYVDIRELSIHQGLLVVSIYIFLSYSQAIKNTFLLLILCCNVTVSCASESKKEASLIANKLTAGNALFDRVVYVKDSEGLEVERKTTHRSLLIFLDESEYIKGERGAATETALAAIKQQACLILISISLLLNAYFIDSSIKKIINSNKFILGNPVNNGGMLILVPTEYLKKIKLENDEHEIWDKLGLQKPATIITDGYDEKITRAHSEFQKNKVDYKAKEIKIAEDRNKKFQDKNKGSSISAQSLPGTAYFMETINNLFLYKPYILPQWSIYMVGHGNVGSSVAGLVIELFKDFLQFLNDKILTKFFFYNTCMSAGNNEQYVYAINSEWPDKSWFYTTISQKIYRFPIMSSGVAEAEVETSFNSTNHYLDFNKFVKNVESKEPVSYLSLVEDFQSFLKMLEAAQKQSGIRIGIPLSSIPRVRPPGYNHFLSIIRPVEINELMAATRSKDSLLDIKKKGSSKSHSGALSSMNIVTLSAQYIPFPVIFSSPVRVLSILPGSVLHVFEKIICHASADVDKRGIFVIKDIFTGLLGYPGSKIFIIKTLIGPDSKVYKDVFIYIPSSSIRTLLPDMEPTLAYTSNGRKYYEDKETDDDYITDTVKEGIRSIESKFKSHKEAVSSIERFLLDKGSSPKLLHGKELTELSTELSTLNSQLAELAMMMS